MEGSSSLEQEAKILLSKIDYEKIMGFAQNTEIKKITQINHYFDTDSFFFRKNGITLRVRQKEDCFTFTIKITDSKTSEDKAKTSYEYNYEIGRHVFDKIKENINELNVEDNRIRRVIENYGHEFAKVKYLGELITHRAIFKPTETSPYVELDENRYLGTTDWELECEIKNGEDLERLEEWLNSLSVELNWNKRGKSTRFIERYKKIFLSGK